MSAHAATGSSASLEKAVRLILPDVSEAVSPPDPRLPPEPVLWRELVFCILGSRVPSELAEAATDVLFRAGVVTLPLHAMDPKEREEAIASLLSQPIYPPAVRNGLGRKYRYPRLRARQIAGTAQDIYISGLSLSELIRSCDTARNARVVIAKAARGIGPKQASLFLTNIGLTDDLAILDTHAVAFMRATGMTDASPRRGSFTEYCALESTLRAYADGLGYSLAVLDLAIWMVMRADRGGPSL
jgi:N-glycosylase/DNA lyase